MIGLLTRRVIRFIIQKTPERLWIMRVQLYDYDKTICPGDTGSAFWLYCLARRPYIVLFLPLQLLGGACYLLGIFGRFHSVCSIHCYMRAVNAEKLAVRFAEKRIAKTYPYFLRRDRSLPTVVCSASPAFLLQPICDALGVDALVATDVDPKTGVVRAPTCKGERKPRYLAAAHPDYVYEAVYSDSLRHDAPILRLGKAAYLVVQGVPQKINPQTLTFPLDKSER